MKTEQIFIGNINKCVKYEERPTCISGSDSFGHIVTDYELYKENVILIKIENGGYVDLERFNSILDHIKIKQAITEGGYILGGLMMPTYAYCMDALFVDKKSLRPYYANADEQQKKNISVHKLKKQVNNKNAHHL